MGTVRLAGVLVRDALRDLGRQRGQNALAAVTLASGLLLAGGGLLAVESLDRWVLGLASRARITVFAAEGGSLEPLAGALGKDKRVKRIIRVSSEEATRRFAALSRDAGLMLQSLDGEKVPENLELELAPEFVEAHRALAVGDSLRDLPGVGDVVVDHERLRAFQRSARAIRGGLAALGVLLLLAAGFTTGNVLRMAVMSREEETTIMRLVGATEGFIRIPLLLQGGAIGLLSSALAVGALYGFWQLLSRGLLGLPPVLVDMARQGFFSAQSLMLLGAMGGVTGIAGAAWGFRATRRAQQQRGDQSGAESE